MPEVPYQYFMTVSPLDGFLYVSDQQARRIVRVKTMGSVRHLASNSAVVAGSGEQCYPGDAARCGDGAPAASAKLFYPKGACDARRCWCQALSLSPCVGVSTHVAFISRARLNNLNM